jgi:hypothetical protein
MPITAQSSDGVSHEFPDGTKPEVIDKVMKEYADKTKDRSTTLGSIETGMMDPIEGGGQLIANVLPKPVTDVLDKTNNWLADRSGGLIRKLPEGGKNEQMRQREAAIQAERGSNTSLDWNRMAGNILSPANFIGLGLAPVADVGATAVERAVIGMEGAEIGGAASGAVQPATSKDYWTEKGFQTGTGALVGAGVGAVGSAAAAGVDKLGEYLARNYPENLQSAAVQKIMRRIKQDQKAGGPSAADAIEAINTAKKPVSLADVGGENVKSLAGNVARSPGPGRQVAQQFLGQRDEQAAARLSADIGKYVSGGSTVHQATEALLQARSAAAKPAYQAAHDLTGIWSPRLEQFLQDPTVKAGLQRGYEIERLQALAEGRSLTASQMGVDIDTEGNVKLLSRPNMRLLDMGKQGLDAMIADERNPLTGRLSARGVALDNMRRAYVTTIDDLDHTGAYKKARSLWAGYSQSLDSMRLGRNVFKLSPEENAAEVEKMSPANREFYRMGVADLLKERLAKAGLNSDEAKAIVKNPWMRDQLRPAFKTSEDFNSFVDAVTTESKMFKTRSDVLGGSQTAARMAEDATDDSMATTGAKIAEKLFHGHPFLAIKTAYHAWQDLGLKPNPEMNEKVAKILFSATLPEDVQKAMLGAVSRTLKTHPGAEVGSAATRAVTQSMAPPLAVDATKERSPQQAASQ